MRAIWRQFVASVSLQWRNPTALIYTYAIPLVFLAAFWTLYRHESPPLGRHLDELLAITALSGACFGLPSWLVSERERGVWRRYRLAPVSGPVLLIGMLAASYVLLLSGAALQLAVAAAIGTAVPARLFDVWLAFTFASVAFLGVGLLITMLADTVPAAQALGQAVFLPMLILGGLAVPIVALPGWAQQVAAALPGRHAIEALDAAISGRGFAAIAPAAAALAFMGGVTALASIAIFRWDAGQRVGGLRVLGSMTVAIASWIAVALVTGPAKLTAGPIAAPEVVRVDTPVDSSSASNIPTPPIARPSTTPAQKPPPIPPRAVPSATLALPTLSPPAPVERTWRDVTMEDVEVNLVFVGLPPDHGVVTPITAEYRRREDVECIRGALPRWAPAQAEDVVQRARNVLLLAAVPDVLQLDLERDVPLVVFDHLQQKIARDDLVKVLYWITTHRSDGDLVASLWAAVAMNALGVLYAWLQPQLTRPADQHH